MKPGTPLAREVHRRAQIRGLSDDALARELGLSRGHLRKLLHGRAAFSLRTLSKIAITFGEPIRPFVLAYLGAGAQTADVPPKRRKRTRGRT